MSKKIIIIFGVISALICLVVVTNDKPREREVKIFDSIKNDEMSIEKILKEMNDVERVEKSLFLEYIQKNEEGLLIQIDEKVNVRMSMVKLLEENMTVYKKDVEALVRFNNAPLLNKETKSLGKSYINVLEKRINYLDEMIINYTDAVKMENELNVGVEDMEIEEIIERLDSINMSYEEISVQSEGYNEIVDELKLNREKYTTHFNYSDN